MHTYLRLRSVIEQRVGRAGKKLSPLQYAPHEMILACTRPDLFLHAGRTRHRPLRAALHNVLPAPVLLPALSPVAVPLLLLRVAPLLLRKLQSLLRCQVWAHVQQQTTRQVWAGIGILRW